MEFVDDRLAGVPVAVRAGLRSLTLAIGRLDLLGRRFNPMARGFVTKRACAREERHRSLLLS